MPPQLSEDEIVTLNTLKRQGQNNCRIARMRAIACCVYRTMRTEQAA